MKMLKLEKEEEEDWSKKRIERYEKYANSELPKFNNGGWLEKYNK